MGRGKNIGGIYYGKGIAWRKSTRIKASVERKTIANEYD